MSEYEEAKLEMLAALTALYNHPENIAPSIVKSLIDSLVIMSQAADTEITQIQTAWETVNQINDKNCETIIQLQAQVKALEEENFTLIGVIEDTKDTRWH